MRLDPETCRRLAVAARSARLATVSPEGLPHLVPIVFAAEGDAVVTVIDAKPKTTTRLRRVTNLETEPRCSLLVDHYEDDWARLWWVRGDGRGTVDTGSTALAEAREVLSLKYPQYRQEPPSGPVIRISIDRWTGWASTPQAVGS